MPRKTVSKKEPKDQLKFSKAQFRRIPELRHFYKVLHEYSLREEAYTVVLQSYIQIKKKSKIQLN